MQMVEVELDPGETVVAEAGAMNYMEGRIDFETKMDDGSEPDKSLFGKLLDAGTRTLTGESIFLTHFTNHGSDKKKVAFAAPYPGRIVPLDMAKVGGEVLCQKDAFLCAALGTSVGIAFNKRLGERQLSDETLRVDTGCLVGFTPGVAYDIQRAGNLKSMFFWGEGMFLATLSGAGTVWLQSLPFSRLADHIIASAPRMGGSSKGEGSVLGGLAGRWTETDDG